MSQGKLHVVVNAGAGHQSGAEMRGEIETALDAAKRDYEIVPAAAPDQLGEAAARAVASALASGGIVVAAGGDGTINTVAAATLASGCPFGVLPSGTFNYFARAHGLPADLAEAARVLLEGRVQPVRVGLINDQLFLVNASLGTYPQLLEDREAWKKRFGRSRPVALAAALATFIRSHRSLRLDLDIDGGPARQITASTVFIGNNRLQLERIGIAEASAVDAGRLVVLTLKPAPPWAMLALIVRGAFGTLGDADEVTAVATTALTIAPSHRLARRRMKVATDGEVKWQRAPLTIRLSPHPLMLVVPEKEAAASAPS